MNKMSELYEDFFLPMIQKNYWKFRFEFFENTHPSIEENLRLQVLIHEHECFFEFFKISHVKNMGKTSVLKEIVRTYSVKNIKQCELVLKAHSPCLEAIKFDEFYNNEY